MRPASFSSTLGRSVRDTGRKPWSETTAKSVSPAVPLLSMAARSFPRFASASSTARSASGLPGAVVVLGVVGVEDVEEEEVGTVHGEDEERRGHPVLLHGRPGRDPRPR